MDDERHELVRIDTTGMAHPVGRIASQRMRARQGSFRLLPAPQHLVVMRFVGEDGKRDAKDGPIFRMAGEITTPGTLCDIVSLVGQAAWKGELFVTDGPHSRSIFFEQGHVVCASSNVEGERLGEVLYRYGALTEEQVSMTAKAASADIRFGETAIKLGFLSREQLFPLMGKQTEEIVFAVLLVGEGMFYFLDTYDENRLAARHNLTVNSLLMEGVRRMDETRYFRERVPSDQHVPAVVAERSPPASEFGSVYAAVDGSRTVAEICRVVGQGEFEVTQALFQLVQSGHIVVHAPRPTGPAAIVALFNEAISMIMAEVDAISKGNEVREQLASFATGAGVYDALFRKAGPAPNGTLIGERIAENIVVMVGPDQAEATLAQWLYEYASFGLFVAEPFLRMRAEGPISSKRDPVAQATLVKRIAALIAPLAPTH